MVRFCSTRLNTLSTSPAGGPLVVVVVPMDATGPASGRGCHLVLEKFVGPTSPTSIHNRYIIVKYFGIHKNDIYKISQKLKNLKKKNVPNSPLSGPRGTGMSGSLEKLILP